MNQLAQYYRRYPITAVFIALSIIISLMTWFGSISTTLEWFIYDKKLILEGQVWRLVTPIFLHFPAMGIIFAHLAFNLIWLNLFGQSIERFESSKFLLILILTSAIISNIAQSMASHFIFGGMSGVVYALFGFVFLRGLLNQNYPAKIPNNLAYFMIGYMIVAATGLLGSGIANTAHIVGFIVGLAFAFIPFKISR